MMQQVLSNTSKVLVDQKNGNNLLYLPLDKLMQTVAPPLAQIPEIPIAVTPEPVIDNASRTREAFRSRERESR